MTTQSPTTPVLTTSGENFAHWKAITWAYIKSKKVDKTFPHAADNKTIDPAADIDQT